MLNACRQRRREDDSLAEEDRFYPVDHVPNTSLGYQGTGTEGSWSSPVTIVQIETASSTKASSGTGRWASSVAI